MRRISVVIPALDEALRIEDTLRRVRAQPGPMDVLVVDGGSTDDTARLAARLADVLASDPGRARQMNLGATHAPSDLLFFLHADTLLPDGAFDAIRAALDEPGVEAGAFRLRFDEDSPLLRLYGLCTRLPLRHLCFGDRGLFVTREAFEAVGGFPPQPMFEDLEIVRRLHARGGFRFLPQHVTTAARRFEEHGRLRQQLRNLRLWLHWLRGTDPHRLVHLYAYDGQKR